MGIDKTRRNLLKIASLGAASALAGCGGGNGGNGNGNGNGGTKTTTTPAGGGMRFDNVTIDYWDMWHNQAKQIGDYFLTVADQFENETGATVKVNQAGYSQALNKWPQNFQRGTGMPHIFSWQPAWNGRMPNEFFHNWDDLTSDYASATGQINLDPFSHVMDMAEYQTRGIDATHRTVPQFIQPRQCIVWRWDYWQEAGITDQYPPQSFEELKSVAQTLQSDSSAEVGFQIPIAEGTGWVRTRSAHLADRTGSKYWGEEFTPDSNVNNDAYIQGAREAKELFDAGLMAENTVSLSDEKTLALITSGKYAGGIAEPMGHALIEEQDPELVENGNIRWQTYDGWGAENQCMQTLWGKVIPNNPNPNNPQQWEQRKRAGIEFLTNPDAGWLSTNVQTPVPNQSRGFWPAREDVWEDAQSNVKWEDQHHWGQLNITLSENTDAPSFDWFPSPYSNVGGTVISELQQMIQGKKGPEQAMNDANETIKQQINQG